MRYAICFDFPELEGEPLFAGRDDDLPLITQSLAEAATFDTEDQAEDFLDGYKEEVRGYATVVEVSA
jgi:hypothetical protein